MKENTVVFDNLIEASIKQRDRLGKPVEVTISNSSMSSSIALENVSKRATEFGKRFRAGMAESRKHCAI